MTVSQLIEHLQTLPPDQRVMVPNGEMPEYVEVAPVDIGARWVKPVEWDPEIFSEDNDGEQVVVIG